MWMNDKLTSPVIGEREIKVSSLVLLCDLVLEIGIVRQKIKDTSWLHLRKRDFSVSNQRFRTEHSALPNSWTDSRWSAIRIWSGSR